MAQTKDQQAALQMAEAFLKTKGVIVWETSLSFLPVKTKIDAWELAETLESTALALGIVLDNSSAVTTTSNAVLINGQVVLQAQGAWYNRSALTLVNTCRKYEVNTVKFGDFVGRLMSSGIDLLLGGPKTA